MSGDSSGPALEDGVEEPEVQEYEGPRSRDEPSRLEIFYSNRARQPLLQFGYQTFGAGHDIILRKSGGVQDNYVIGVGDSISVDLRGQENRSFRIRVDNSGRVILPKLDPIVAAGRQFGEFREQLERLVEAAYIATNVFVSVGEVRQISVLVSGDVNNPGPLTLSGLSTSIDALALAGGVKKTGSLRNITVFRGDRTIEIDLYSVLLGRQQSNDFSLMEGDRIHVAPLGKVVAIGGWVKRPGIYEIQDDDPVSSTDKMIVLAGGMEIKGRYRLSLLRVENGGGIGVVDVVSGRTPVREGDLLLIEASDERTRGAVHLEGHVRQSGTVALAKAPTLKVLLAGGDVIGASPYMPYAIVARIDPGSQFRTYIPFSPVEIIYGAGDLSLVEDDVVHIFSLDEMRRISETLDDEGDDEPATEENVDGLLQSDGTLQSPSNVSGAKRLEDIVYREAEEVRLGTASRLSKVKSKDGKDDRDFPSITARDLLKSGLAEMGFDQRLDFSNPVLINLIKESRISFFGSVKAPGNYVVMPGISLGQALQVAGGPAGQADLSAVEITSTQIEPLRGTSHTTRKMVPLTPDSLKNVKLRPYDVIRVRHIFSSRQEGSVEITGEVRYPGQFDLQRGERLSNLLNRSGGLTSSAYPYGSVFTRISAAQTEKDARDRMVDRMESQLGMIVATGDTTGDGGAFLANLITRLKQSPTHGRIAIDVGPGVLISMGDKDFLLEPGDRLYIPPRPSSVSVIGEVLMPSSYSFDAAKDAKDYIRIAGGYGRIADKKRAYMILPDGQSVRLRSGRWKLGNAPIAPGTVVVVPRNLRPFQWDEVLLSVTEIASQLALTAASLSVVASR